MTSRAIRVINIHQQIYIMKNKMGKPNENNKRVFYERILHDTVE